MLYREKKKKNLLYEMNKNVSWLTLFSLLKSPEPCFVKFM